MRFFIFISSFALMTACSAPVTSAETPQGGQQSLTSAAPHEKTDIKPQSAGNTYQGGCDRVLDKALSEMTRPDEWTRRLEDAASTNSGKLAQTFQPALRELPARIRRSSRANVGCLVQMDVDAKGFTGNIAAICTDAELETPVANAFAVAEYQPAVVNGRAVALEALVTDFKICTTH